MNLNHNRQEEILIMTKSKKSLIVGAALAGLMAGSAGVRASTLLHGVRASLTSQDPGSTSEKAKDPKDRHACKGQNSCKGKGACKSGDQGCKAKNSCKGKGGCRTDGKKVPEKSGN
jgi:hypothetical protein